MSTKRLTRTLAFMALFFSSSALFAQVKIGTNPTTINTANNLEVEAATTGRKTSVDKVTGQVTIKDGTEGLNKLLTSDANGGASWQTTSTLKIQQTVYTAYFSGSVSLLTPTTGNVTRVPFTVANPSADYNAATRQYTIPTTGMYRVEFNAQLDNQSAGKTFWNEWVSLYSTGGVSRIASFIVNGPSAGWGPALFLTGVFSAGDKVEVQIASYDVTGPLRADPMVFSNGSMIVTKLD